MPGLLLLIAIRAVSGSCGEVRGCVREDGPNRGAERLHRGSRNQGNQNQQQCIFREVLASVLAIQPKHTFLHVFFAPSSF